MINIKNVWFDMDVAYYITFNTSMHWHKDKWNCNRDDSNQDVRPLIILEKLCWICIFAVRNTFSIAIKYA